MNKQQIKTISFVLLIVILLYYNESLIIQTAKNLLLEILVLIASWEAFSSITSIVIIIFIYTRLIREKNNSYGNFFINLNNSTLNNESYKKVFVKLNNYNLDKSYNNEFKFTESDAFDITTCSNFFVVIKVLIDKKLLHFEDIDGMYAW
ncbi:MAG: hypothetical protein U9N04_04460 [Patescibacteria group bacterium]|nr:hypothetical protein [Patescibacteria group bacterium]